MTNQIGYFLLLSIFAIACVDPQEGNEDTQYGTVTASPEHIEGDSTGDDAGTITSDCKSITYVSGDCVMQVTKCHGEIQFKDIACERIDDLLPSEILPYPPYEGKSVNHTLM